MDAQAIRNANDVVVISTGATWPRDLKIPNREADGIHFAMEFLQVLSTQCLCPLPSSWDGHYSLTPRLCWIPNLKMETILTREARTLLSSEVVIPGMTASERLCATVPSPSLISSCYPSPQPLEHTTILGLNGLGGLFLFQIFVGSNKYLRIFRTDYGHTEVAAHFGNGTYITPISPGIVD